MVEIPKAVAVGQINQAAAGILQNAGYASKRLKNFRMRRIAEVENFDGFRGAVRIANDSLGVFVGDFGKADVGTHDFEFARRSVGGLVALIDAGKIGDRNKLIQIGPQTRNPRCMAGFADGENRFLEVPFF